jgi:4-hydroxy-3-methylbut-2-enyl diphosphate reductase
MKVIRAKYLGMCFGVRDAISLALQQARKAPLTIYGDLVHNETVLSSLQQEGIKIERDARKILTPDVMITAHGASERTLAELQSKGLHVLEATCPLVHNAHAAVRRMVEQKLHPVIVGKRDHVEVRGMTEDLTEYDVVLTEEDIDALTERPRFGVAAQTTQPIEKVRYLVSLIRRRFPKSEVQFEDTVCQPTKQRQQAAIELAQSVDAVVVVGGPKSNNTRELAATCSQHCRRVHTVQDCSELNAEWFVGIDSVGLTAGTSTPDHIIDVVESWLVKLGTAEPVPPPILTANQFLVVSR